MRRLAPLVLALLAPACDLNHFALVNSVPVEASPSRNPVVDVYLAVDGLPASMVAEMMAAGELPEWSAAPMISMFPSMSDASWTRILRAPAMEGPELHYYDRDKQSLENGGVYGIFRHGVPPVPALGVKNAPYYDAFDYFAEGYLDVVTSYAKPEEGFAESLDGLFYVLSRRVKTDPVFVAYVLEIDVLAHMRSREDVQQAFRYLLSRLSAFAARYPRQQIRYTLFSDHGNDYVRAEPSQGHFIEVPAEMRRLGIRPVSSLLEGRERPGDGLYAVPVVHTPVSYFAVHTEVESAPAVAQKLSESPYADVVVAVATPAADLPGGDHMEWFSIWQEGREAVRFAYQASSDSYFMPVAGAYGALGMAPIVGGTPVGGYRRISDEELYAGSAARDLPDLFFRTRTALQPVGMKFPPTLYFTFRRPYTSSGVKIIGVKDPATAGFHGNMRKDASYGVILTQARELPGVVRSDDFLQLFPSFAEHLARKKVTVSEDVFGLGLDYDRVGTVEPLR